MRALHEMIREAGLALYSKKPVELFEELKGKTIVILDTETTGLNHVRNQLTEVAAVVIKGPDFDIIDSFDEKIALTEKTRKQIEDEKDTYKADPKFFGVEKVLKYNKYHDNPKPGRDEMEVLEDFKKFVSKYGQPILMGQNAKFDLSFIGSRIGKLPKEQVYDTMYFAKFLLLPAVKVLSEKGVLKEQVRRRLLNKPRKPEPGQSAKENLSTSLEYLLKGFGVKEKGLHTALTDVKQTAKVFQKIMKYFEEYVEVADDADFKTEQGKSLRKDKENRRSPGKKKWLEEQKKVADMVRGVANVVGRS